RRQMFRGSRIDITTKPIVEQMRLMRLNRLARHVNSNYEVNVERRDYFPILALPKELIALIFSFLPIKDRLRARVNKKLNSIEAESKYHVKRLIIHEVWEVLYPNPPSISTQYMLLSTMKSYSSDMIRKITNNSSFESLEITLIGSDKFHRKVCHLIKEFKMDSLKLDIRNAYMKKGTIIDSFLIDLSESCKYLILNDLYVCTITAETLLQIFMNIIDGSTLLRSLKCYLLKKETVTSFLRLYGITIRDGVVFSNKRIEAYEMLPEKIRYRFYDGSMEIAVGVPFAYDDSNQRIEKKSEDSRSQNECSQRFEYVNIVSNVVPCMFTFHCFPY
ncbi:hypothetical protein PMAYCL1PPCAC_01473, partial [Pristionchus mayeri]